jgi:hypothetical protein
MVEQTSGKVDGKLMIHGYKYILSQIYRYGLLRFKSCIHRRVAEIAESIFFSFADERPANEKLRELCDVILKNLLKEWCQNMQ